MSELPSPSNKPLDLESSLTNACSAIRSFAHDPARSLEQCISQSPKGSLALAASTGYLLHLIPVRRLLVGSVRLTATVLPPFLLVLGAAKLVESFSAAKPAAGSRPQRKPTVPKAHEDLTIREQLEEWIAPVEHPVGELVFQDDSGTLWSLPESAAVAFLEQHGAEHASDYAALHGSSWEKDFLALGSRREG